MDYSKLYNALLGTAKNGGFQSVGDAIRAAIIAKQFDPSKINILMEYGDGGIAIAEEEAAAESAAPVSAPIASTPEPAEPDLQQLKALAQQFSLLEDDEISLVFAEAASPAVVLDLIARIEHEREVAASWQRTAEKKDRDWNKARMAFENYKCEQRAAYPAAASGDMLDIVSKALNRAWQLGQTYWQQADNESYKQNMKSRETEAKFDAFIEETRAAVSAATKPTADLPKTWQERIKRFGNLPIGTVTATQNDCMREEIAELRSLLATKPAAAPEQEQAKAERPTVIKMSDQVSLRYEARTTGEPGWLLYIDDRLVRAMGLAEVDLIEASLTAGAARQGGDTNNNDASSKAEVAAQPTLKGAGE